MQISRNIDAWYLHSDSFIRTLTVGTGISPVQP